MRELLVTLDEQWGPFHLFRPNRDVRFAKDKSPYKTALGAVGESERAAHFYVQISAAGLFVGVRLLPHGLRPAGALPRRGRRRAARRAAREARPRGRGGAGSTCTSRDPLKTAPRGYPKDHPRVELLRGKGLTAGTEFPIRKWLHTAAVREKVVETWSAARPLYGWLERNVGPSTAPPPEPD